MSKELQQPLYGFVKRVYTDRLQVVSIVKANGEEYKIAADSQCLYDNVKIGDTIIKQADTAVRDVPQGHPARKIGRDLKSLEKTRPGRFPKQRTCRETTTRRTNFPHLI